MAAALGRILAGPTTVAANYLMSSSSPDLGYRSSALFCIGGAYYEAIWLEISS